MENRIILPYPTKKKKAAISFFLELSIHSTFLANSYYRYAAVFRRKGMAKLFVVEATSESYL